jgi:hypothetical protein
MGGTYEVIKLHLHGLFLAKNVWRDNRNSQGYQVTSHEDSQLDDSDSFEDEEEAMELAAALDDVLALLLTYPQFRLLNHTFMVSSLPRMLGGKTVIPKGIKSHHMKTPNSMIVIPLKMRRK